MNIMYWILDGKPEDDISGTIIEGVLIDSNFQIIGNILNDGKSVSNEYPVFYIKPFLEKCRFGIITDRMAVRVNGIDLLVVSNAFKNYLSLELKEIEFIPVIILGTEFKKDYFIVNPLEKTDCIDEEKSWYLPIKRHVDNTIYEINSLAIDDSKVPDDVELFLLGRTELSVIISSDRLKKEIENRFSGCKFTDPEDLKI